MVHWTNTHNLFIQSSVDGHSGCFQLLGIMKNVAMNIDVHLFWCICTYTCMYLRMKLLDHIVGSTSKDNSKRLSNVLKAICTSPTGYASSYCFIHLVTQSFSFKPSHTPRCGVCKNCSLLAFFWLLMMLSIFAYVCLSPRYSVLLYFSLEISVFFKIGV